MSDYERVKRWREKNRARYNLYQRNRRKGLVSVEKEAVVDDATYETGGGKTKIEELRDLVRMEESRKPEEGSTMPVAKPQVFRNDYGAVISESAWKRLHKLKEEAKEGGYEIDEYSQ